ncbi:uncharacterized protein M421DRAFT_209364, partial [Didymella exigua CBS 183.55]
MCSMKPLRIPNNLFVTCSLARTLELFKLHRDSHRLDIAITQQFSSGRPIFAIEIETMWTCLGKNDRYVYACVRALSRRVGDSKVAEDVQSLAERPPELYARLRDPGLNELYTPQFGREWFGKLQYRSSQSLRDERSGCKVANTAALAASHLILHPRNFQRPDVHVQ